MTMNRTIFLILSMGLTTMMNAQSRDVVSRYVDSLQVAREHTSSQASPSQTINPYYYQMFFPSTYYSSAAHGVFTLDDGEMTPVDMQLMQLYASRPSAVGSHDTQYEGEQLLLASADTRPADEIRSVISQAKAETVPASKVGDDIDIGLEVKRPNFWKTSGTAKLQFTQNYFSENWYSGGNNNETMLSQILLSAIYNDTKKITWENRLDMQLGFVTTTSDSLHNYLTNNDRLQLNTKLGVKAAKSWKYTVSGEAKTQFLPGYRSNKRDKFSAFISPLDVSVSVGMDFNPILKNGNRLSVAILPLSYKMRYIGSDDENIHRVYNFVGRTTQQDYGSRLEVNCQFTIVKNLTWRCRSYYFTSYEYTEAELENVFTFKFSKYISSEVNTLWRFDDNRGPQHYDDNLGYFQFKENFTLGLTYDF